MLLLGVRNVAEQDLEVGEIVNLGSAYRHFYKKDCGVSTFTFNGTSLTLNRSGIYHVTATAIVSAPVAGVVTLSLFSNGVAIPGAIASETITTATTELRTLVIDTYVLVDTNCVLGTSSTTSQNLTLVNAGVASTISNVVVNVDKVL